MYGTSSTRDFLGGQKAKRTPTATDYTVTLSDYIIAVTSTVSPRIITLPAAASSTNSVFIIKDESGGAKTNDITIDGNGLDTIDGALTFVINKDYGSITLYSNGIGWFII